MNFTDSIQAIIDSLNPGDRVKITYATGTIIEATLVQGDYGAWVTYALGGTKMTLNRWSIDEIEIIQRARPELKPGDLFRFPLTKTSYIVVHVHEDGRIRAIRDSQDSDPIWVPVHDPIIKVPSAKD